MKYTILVLLMLAGLSSVCQSQIISSEGDTIRIMRVKDLRDVLDTVINDTFFIQRQFYSSGYYRTYIETNRNSWFYKQMFDNSYWKKPRKDYYWDQVKKASKKFSKLFKSNQPLKLPQDWQALYPYRGKYYMYTPSDWAKTEVIRISDHSISYPGMEDQFYSPFVHGHWINSKTYCSTTCTIEEIAANLEASSSATCDQVFHILDEKKGLLLIEYPLRDSDFRYSLYVSLDHAKEYDMIVIWADSSKPMDFPSDPIDGEALLKQYGRR